MDNKRIQQRGNAMPTIRQRRKMQRDFLGALGPMGHLLKTVLDICPDVFAWFADMDDRLMFVNRLNVQMCNFHTEFDAVGKSGYCGIVVSPEFFAVDVVSALCELENFAVVE